MFKSIPAIPAALMAMLSVQVGAGFAKTLFPAVGPEVVTTLRVGLSALLLLAINRPNLRTISKIQWKYILAFGFSLAAMNLVFFLALQRIPLGLAVTVEFIGPLLLAFIASRKPIDILWALLAATGIMLIVPWKTNDVDLIGLGLAFLAGMFWACYIIIAGKAGKLIEQRVGLTMSMCFATLLVFPFGYSSGGFAAMNLEYLLLGFVVAILSSALPFSLDYIALKKLPAKDFSILTSLQPALGALSGLLFLQEMLSLWQWLSVLCVISASLGTTLFSRAK